MNIDTCVNHALEGYNFEHVSELTAEDFSLLMKDILKNFIESNELKNAVWNAVSQMR